VHRPAVVAHGEVVVGGAVWPPKLGISGVRMCAPLPWHTDRLLRLAADDGHGCWWSLRAGDTLQALCNH
jgi:hypothetical protein